MKKLFAKLASQPSDVMPDYDQNPKRNFWKFIIQTLISILTAILTALGATSCMNALG